jgi:hypothetical protein
MGQTERTTLHRTAATVATPDGILNELGHHNGRCSGAADFPGIHAQYIMSSGRLTLVQGKFDVKDFVGAFSEKLIAQSKADSGRV